MKRPAFSVRDLFWLMLVAGLGLGWWADQDRMRREREALQAAAENLQTASVKSAEKQLAVAEAEFAQVNEIQQRAPGAVSKNEIHRAGLQVDAARVDLEQARAKEKYARPTTKLPSAHWKGTQ